MIATLKKLFWVSRPISWPNTAYPFAVAYLVLGGQVDIVFILGTVFFLFPYNLMMYGVNDVFDYESDILNPRKGGVEGMKEERVFHPTIIRAVVLTSLPFIVYFLSIGSPDSRITFAGLIFFVLAYSLKYMRFKEVPVLDSITSSIHFVGPMVFAMSLLGFPGVAWPAVAAFFLWGMASHAFGAVQDVIPDRKGGLHSIATVIGARATVRVAVALYILSALSIGLSGGWSLLVAIAGLLYAVNLWPFLNVTDKDSATTNIGWKRFIRLNYLVGFVVTITIILYAIT